MRSHSPHKPQAGPLASKVTVIRKALQKVLPDVARLREQKTLGVFGEHLFHPALWSLNRRSVAGGVAVGLFCGLIPGPLQMGGSAIGAMWFRINLPVALVTTLYTNPFTIIPLYILAYTLGSWVWPGEAPALPPAPSLSLDPAQSMQAMADWSQALGKPLLVGIPLLALLLAACGYVVVRLGWESYLRIVRYRRRRQATRRRARPL